jgi:hypothetical protein
MAEGSSTVNAGKAGDSVKAAAVQRIVDGGPECGCRYGLAGPEYGK